MVIALVCAVLIQTWTLCRSRQTSFARTLRKHGESIRSSPSNSAPTSLRYLLADLRARGSRSFGAGIRGHAAAGECRCKGSKRIVNDDGTATSQHLEALAGRMRLECKRLSSSCVMSPLRSALPDIIVCTDAQGLARLQFSAQVRALLDGVSAGSHAKSTHHLTTYLL